MISISKLIKEYGKVPVVSIESLQIAQGESFGLVGNNGAGKTTLFRIILDLVRPSVGEVLIHGKNVQGSDDWKSYVGSYLDENFLISYLSPDEYFRFVGKLHGYSKSDISVFIEKFEPLFNGEIIGKVKYIRDLSKGNLKKVGIAAALIGNPQIIILDEPFENLDPTSQRRLKEILKEECTNRKATIVISSHDLNHVTDICTRIVIMEKGKVVKDIKGGQEGLKELEEYFNPSLVESIIVQ